MASLNGALSVEDAEHVRGCAHCLAVTEVYEALGRTSVPAAAASLESVRAAAMRELSAQPDPRPWWRPSVVLVCVELAVAAAGAVVLNATRATHSMPILAAAAIIAGAMLAGALLAMSRGSNREARWAVALIAIVAGAVLAAGAAAPGAVTTDNCLGSEVLLSLLPAGVAVWLLTRTAYRPGRTFLAALSAGVAGLVGLDLHCPDGSWQHLAAFHLAPWLAVGGLAVLLRSRLASKTYAP
jgi:hypothetical protein